MWRFAFCALLVPSLVAAAAFPWAIPEPTFVTPAFDNWSPVPTQAPVVGSLELFGRAAANEICGYLSGISTSSLTCHNSNDACATNTYYGAHGCCPQGSLSSCTIPTTCIPSTLMSASCTDEACSSNGFTAKCTGSAAPECYEWYFVYSTDKVTTLTEFGCAAEATTATIERTYSGYVDPNASTSETLVSTKTTTETTTPTLSAGTTPLTATQNTSKSNNTPAIIGGAIGGLVVVGAIITLIVFLLLRDRRHKREQKRDAAAEAQHQSWISNPSGPAPGVTEYNPDGFSPTTSPWLDQGKPWHKGSPTDCGVNGGFVGPDGRRGRDDATLFGFVETAGTQVHEAPG
ncbi:hypothetical protein K458DRAFT_399527 [Lentithecium fluviatile CBS 122367]|uniref:Mid2 domain-containing protein n=1 Tax=Lentithecium fluviatile CBS 122367 TaxID=1168545 RepID=A0A6G1JIT5_9PLEO|nr:hypothetical protein K458DRAFT_399527 [Lentithecium fluviatile CBS 122367]